MIPLRDDAPRWSFPWVTVCLISVNAAVFFYQFALLAESPRAAEEFVFTWGAIPLRVVGGLTGRLPFFEGVVPLFTSIFLHGGLLHLLGNVWFLWIFGDNVEDELGHLPFAVFYLVCGLFASVAHILSGPSSTIPTVGASGAIAGVMGAYLVRFPAARIVVLLPLVFIWTTVELPAVLMLLYWFFIQFFSGAASYGMSAGGGVAWWAHVGGFLAGALLIWSRPRRRRYRRIYYHY